MKYTKTHIFIVAVILLILIGASVYFGYRQLTMINVTAVFNECELYSKHLDVFYKGFKIGNVTKIDLSDNGKAILMTLHLNMKELKLPDNVTAKLKVKNKNDYVELEYPNLPSENILINCSIIKGTNSFNINTYLDKQADSGGLDEIKNNLNNTISAAGDTMNALTSLITTCDDILKDIRPAIKESSLNIANTTKNLESASEQLNKATHSKKISNSAFNLEQSTKNIELATRNFNSSSQNIFDITNDAKIKLLGNVESILNNTNEATGNLNCAMLQVRNILSNAEEIVNGIKKTLSKNMSGMRILLGKALR